MLELKNVSKTFNPGTINAKTALSGLNLRLNDGDFVTVIGGNGAGKSTMLNAIAGAFEIDGGSISIDGVDITRQSEHKRAAMIGRVFQDPMLGTAPTMTIEENLALAARRGRRRTLAWGIKRTERSHYRDQLARLGLGLEDRMTSRAGLLSGGQRQALTLLMASLVKPRLLLLDEPAAGMNPQETQELGEYIVEIKKNHDLTILMIEHHMDLVMQFSDRIYVIDFGKMISSGTPDVVKADRRVIDAYLGVVE